MAEKDITEKKLEDYNDVFADIVNGLLFQGRQVVKAEDLENETPQSVYKAEGKLHEQIRDVAKHWKNLFEIAWLEPEQVALFRSDFRIVADYFVQMRKNKDYQPSAETITHVHEVLQLMTALTGDDRFEQAVNQEETEEGGVRTMCEALDKVEARGRKIGEAEGEARGEETMLLQNVRSLMKAMQWTAEHALEILNISENDRGKYVAMLEAE